jgi:hypothetical protein
MWENFSTEGLMFIVLRLFEDDYDLRMGRKMGEWTLRFDLGFWDYFSFNFAFHFLFNFIGNNIY